MKQLSDYDVYDKFRLVTRCNLILHTMRQEKKDHICLEYQEELSLIKK